MHLPYIKICFQQLQWIAFLFTAQITEILLFSIMKVLEISKIAVSERHLFKKKICYGSFEFVCTFHKKVFSGAPVKCLFLYGSNNSDCVIFGNAAFGEINDRSLRTTPFQKKICHGSCEFVSTLSKKVFLGAPVKCVFLWEWLYTRQSGTQNLNSKCPAFQKFRLQVTGTRHINSKCPAL